MVGKQFLLGKQFLSGLGRWTRVYRIRVRISGLVVSLETCVLEQDIIIASLHPGVQMGTVESWGVTCNGLPSCPGGIETFQLGSAQETGCRHFYRLCKSPASVAHI